MNPLRTLSNAYMHLDRHTTLADLRSTPGDEAAKKILHEAWKAIRLEDGRTA